MADKLATLPFHFAFLESVCTFVGHYDSLSCIQCFGVHFFSFLRNVMSSQDVVDFVKRRLESGVTKLSAICEEVSCIRLHFYET